MGAGGVSYYRVMPTFHNPTGHCAYIMNMYVRPAYRRRGIATAMLDVLVADARRQGVGRIGLEATDMGRPLYERYGFIRPGRDGAAMTAREMDRVAALSAVRVPAQPEEYDIHAAVAKALADAGLEYIHEYRLGPRRRIDFRVGRVGIEVKKGRPATSQLTEQLRRYLESDALDAVIVVTQRATACPIPSAASRCARSR